MLIGQLQKISSRHILLTLVLISIVTVAMAYTLENYFGIYGCQMCHYERDIFIGAGLIALLCFILLPERLQYYAILFIGFIFFCGALFAAYHVAIQQHLTSLPFFCPPDLTALGIQASSIPFVRCDDVTWRLFGLSLAAYNALASICLAILCWLWGYKRT